MLTKQSLIWAGRSGEDRYLGMVEASGSIPDRSTKKLLIIKLILLNTTTSQTSFYTYILWEAGNSQKLSVLLINVFLTYLQGRTHFNELR